MDVVVVIAIVVAVVVGIATVAATWRWGSRRGELSIDSRTVLLQAISFEVEGKVEVAPLNPPVQFAVQFRLRNTGRNDISEADFGGHPLDFSLGRDSLVVGLASQNVPVVRVVEDTNRVELPPRRIPAKTNLLWTLHVTGERPYVQVMSPIHDTKVKFKDHKISTGPATLTLGMEYGFRGGKWLRERVTYL